MGLLPQLPGCEAAICFIFFWHDEGLGVFRLRILDPLEGNRSAAEGGSSSGQKKFPHALADAGGMGQL